MVRKITGLLKAWRRSRVLRDLRKLRMLRKRRKLRDYQEAKVPRRRLRVTRMRK